MGKILFAEKDGVQMLKFVGDVRLNLGPTIASFQQRLLSLDKFRAMVIDLSETSAIDSTALGLIAKIAIATREQFDKTTSIISPNPDITRILKSMAMEQVCVISGGALTASSDELVEIEELSCSEDSLRDQVLEAHRVLMSLDAENQEKFQDLVDALEGEKAVVPIARAC